MDPAADPDLFPRLVRQHQTMVFSLAWHMLGNPALAEELAQDVFCELFQHLAELESERHVLFWLRKVASRRAIDQMRRLRLRPRISLDDIAEPAAPPAAADPLRDQRLRQWVAALPPDQSLAVVLRYQEDLDPAEIAHLLGEPVNTIKSRLQRALQTLRVRAAALKPAIAKVSQP